MDILIDLSVLSSLEVFLMSNFVAACTLRTPTSRSTPALLLIVVNASTLDARYARNCSAPKVISESRQKNYVGYSP